MLDPIPITRERQESELSRTVGEILAAADRFKAYLGQNSHQEALSLALNVWLRLTSLNATQNRPLTSTTDIISALLNGQPPQQQ